MTELQRRDRNRFLRASAYTAVGLGALQVIVRVVGDVVLWVLAVRTAHAGWEPIAYPEMPWGYWTSIAGFVVLSMIGAAFWKNQIGEPGRVIDLVLAFVPGRRPGTRGDDDA